MCEFYTFKQEMQPARPYPPALHPEPEFHPVSEPPTPEQWEWLAVCEGLAGLIREFGAVQVMAYVTGASTSDREGVGVLVERFGYQRIVTAVRNLAFVETGEAVDRPLDRCLADGSVLPPSRICVRCGRDNQ